MANLAFELENIIFEEIIIKNKKTDNIISDFNVRIGTQDERQMVEEIDQDLDHSGRHGFTHLAPL